MGQKDGEKWTAAVDSQPTLPKPDRLLVATSLDPLHVAARSRASELDEHRREDGSVLPRSSRGKSGGPVMEPAIWTENVPFAETRDYVKKVLASTTNYAALLTGQPQSLKARLGSVGARDASAPPSDEKMP